MDQIIARSPGFYVEGLPFGNRVNQARARAEHLANLYGRPVDVVYTINGLMFETFRTVYPKGQPHARMTATELMNVGLP